MQRAGWLALAIIELLASFLTLCSMEVQPLLKKETFSVVSRQRRRVILSSCACVWHFWHSSEEICVLLYMELLKCCFWGRYKSFWFPCHSYFRTFLVAKFNRTQLHVVILHTQYAVSYIEECACPSRMKSKPGMRWRYRLLNNTFGCKSHV